jgi:GT2 family glycosyltransferase
MPERQGAAVLNTPRIGMARACVIIVNYRTSRHVVRALESLQSELAGLPGTRVLVVDNCSGDDSVEFLWQAVAERGWSAWVRIIAHDRNGGFAAGNNVAMREDLRSEVPSDFYLLLNPDAYIRPGALRKMMEFMVRHPEVGVAGSGLEDPDGTPQAAAFRFYNLLSELNAGLRLGLVTRLLSRHVTALPPLETNQQVQWVSGASMMIRRAVLEDIGLMDESYFLYYEETDFQLRATRAGWSIWHVHDAAVVHLMGQATGVTGAAGRERRRPRYWYESRRRFFQQQHGRLYAYLVDLCWFAGFSLWRLRRLIQRKPDTDPPGLWLDFLRWSVLRPL